MHLGKQGKQNTRNIYLSIYISHNNTMETHVRNITELQQVFLMCCETLAVDTKKQTKKHHQVIKASNQLELLHNLF